MKISKLLTLCASLTLGLIIAGMPVAEALVVVSQGKASSAGTTQFGFPASNGNDASLTTRWGASNGAMPQWWKVDLGMPYTMSQIDITFSQTHYFQYKVEASNDDSTYTTIVDQSTNVTPGDLSYTFPTVVTARYVRLTVTASNGSTWASIYDLKLYESPAVPAAPTGLTPVEGDSQVGLSWTTVSGATGYNVYRATTSGGPYTVISSNQAGLSFTDTGRTNGTGYYYIVRALNASGEGSPSTQVGATPTNLPSPWLTQDIGTGTALGSASFSSGTYTAAGSGADVGGTADSFRYIYQTATGDCTVIARVATLQNTNALAKAGVMIRDSLAANAINASVVVTPTSGILFQRRTTAGGSTSSTTVASLTAPYWVKLVRTGNSLTAFRSPDGTTWTAIGTAQTVTMGSTVYIGFPTSSHVAATLCTATFDNVTPGVVAPAAPSGLGATAVSASQINLAWTDNSTTETGFRIERKTGAGGTYAEIGTVGANVSTYNDTTGLSPSTTYYYQVRAYNAGGNSAYSASANATTLAPPPLAPSAITFGTPTSSAVTVSWTDNSSDETGFKIERKTGSSGTYAQVGTSAANTPTFPDSGLSTFTTYYYRVRANNAGGDSGYAPEMSVTTLDVAPAAPSGLTLDTPTNTTSNHVDMHWTDNSNGATGNETNFLIERKTGSGGTFAQVGIVGANVTTFSDTGVASGITAGYYYRVRATNSGGNSASYSNTIGPAATTGTVITTPNPPTTAFVDSDKIDISFDADASNTILIYRSTSSTGGTFVQVGSVAPGGTVFHDTGLNASTTYVYQIRASNSSGANNSAFTAPVNRKTLVAAPSNLTLSMVDTSHVQLTWQDNSNNEGSFTIMRKTGVGGAYASAGSASANATQFTNNNLSTDTDYHYYVYVPQIPFGGSSDHSVPSNEASIIIMGTPALTATSISSTQIDLAWTGVSTNAAGVKIERKPDGGSWSEIDSVASTPALYHDSGLSANTTYVYRIRSYRTPSGTDIGGYSLYSPSANTSTLIGGTLPSPWVHADVGTPTPAGDAGYTSGTFTIKGAGNDTDFYYSGMPSSDSFHYVYQPLNGDGTIIARVVSVDNTLDWANAGIMIRETLTGPSLFAMAAITPGYGHGISLIYRSATGQSNRITPEDGITGPYWLKLVRSGNRFTASKSSDGTTWAPAGAITVPMATNVYVGLVVCAKLNALCKTVIDNVSVTAGGVSAVPTTPGDPTYTSVTSNSMTVNWAASSNQTGYRIERKTDGGNYAVIATVGAGVTSYPVTGLTAGTNYYYRVLAYNSGGDSDYSGATFTTTTGGVVKSLLSEDKPSYADAVQTGQHAEQGNDGDLTGTKWTAGGGFNHWWKVDLGASYALNKVKIAWNNDGTYWFKYKIETSPDNGVYSMAMDKTANGGGSAADTTDAISATARWVKVTITGCTNSTKWPSFFECQIYRAGTEPPGATAPSATAMSTNQIRVAWTDNASTESGVKIQRRTGTTGVFTQIGTAPANATTYDDYRVAANTQYYYRVLPYSDTDGDATDYSDIVTATTPTAATTVIKREYYTGITGSAVSNLTSSAAYIAGTPTGTTYLTNFEAPANWGDNYGQVLSGLVTAPTTGDYIFWIACDSTGELYISTDSNPANLGTLPIAELITNVGPRDWVRQQSAGSEYHMQSTDTDPGVLHPIHLIGGQSYYIKALHKEGTGSDHLAIAWSGPGFSRQLISDNSSTMATAITSPSNGATVAEGSNLTIDATATAGSGRSIVKIEFLRNAGTYFESKLGEDTSSPYSYTWNNVPSGSHTITARAWDNMGVSVDSTVKVMATNSTFGSGTWAERILNGDGVTINWTEYDNVANSYDTRATEEYRFGPSYAYYNPTPGTFPTLPTKAAENGQIGHIYYAGMPEPPYLDWYSEGGQMLFSPNTDASAKYQSGVAQAWNGDVYTFTDPQHYGFIMGVQWNGEDGHGSKVPDPSVQQPLFIAANGGAVAPPVVAARTAGAGGLTGFLLFKNGMITGAGNGDTDGYYNAGYAFTQLAPGKVPTAAAPTINNEFLLVTVWDTINHKGQLAVVACEGQSRAQQNTPTDYRNYFWGIPSRFKIKSLKVLGYIDLPSSMSAPSAISTSLDMSGRDGLGQNDNIGLAGLLDSQAERDTWYNWSGSFNYYKKTAKSGYAIVASRAEKKIVFIDLQPLFEYYRVMYFTTQANYDLTKKRGFADSQWPYSFTYEPSQVPTVGTPISLSAPPTAVLAGQPQSPFGGAGTTDAYKTNAYVTTMDGHLYIYNIGDLITPDSAVGVSLTSDIAIGRNPTSIDGNIEFRRGVVINCRGDKTIHLIDAYGVIISTLTDSRIQDPVYTTVSQNGRQTYGINELHVLDFEGSQTLTYRFGTTADSDTNKPPVDPLGTGFEFGHIDQLPGSPFMFNRCGEN